MNAQPPNSGIPVSWLRRVPEGYRQPLWRWFILPASALMVRHYGGAWVSGVLQIGDTGLLFSPNKASAFLGKGVIPWQLPFSDIAEVDFKRGKISETILIRHRTGTEKILSARSEPFFHQLQAAVANRPATASATAQD